MVAHACEWGKLSTIDLKSKTCRKFDLSNGVGFGVGIGLVLRNVCHDCFKTTKVNKHKSKTAHRVLFFNKTT